MKNLKLLNKNNLLILLILIFFQKVYSAEPVDIWNLEKKSNDEATFNNEMVGTEAENESLNSIYNIESGNTMEPTINQEKNILSKNINIIDHKTPIDGSTDSKSDQIRIGHIHEIIRVSNLGPFMSKHKIFIVDEAERLNIEASNAFLKLLEEPPPHSIFLFLVNDISLLSPTIVSRAQIIRLSEASEKVMSNYLAENFNLDKPTEDKIIQLSAGKIKLAESLANNISLLDDYKESYNRFFDYCNSDLSDRLNTSQKLSSRFRTDRNVIYNELSLWADFCKIIIKKKYTKIQGLNYDNKLEDVFDINQINKIILILLKTISSLKENANSRLVFDVMGLNIPGKKD